MKIRKFISVDIVTKFTFWKKKKVLYKGIIDFDIGSLFTTSAKFNFKTGLRLFSYGCELNAMHIPENNCYARQ